MRYRAKLGYHGGHLVSYSGESKKQFRERVERIAFLLDPEEIEIEET